MAKFYKLSLLLILLGIIPSLHAHILETEEYWNERLSKEFDSYWKKRAVVAENINKLAYSSDPYAVSGNLTSSVTEILVENKGRRNLAATGGSSTCKATNPIDRCWRCDPNWAENRQKLADCVLGFGRDTVGGKGGPIYVVNDTSDDIMNPKPGTLRHAVIRDGPLWIIFSHSMVITLKQELIMTSNKTIDGRGANVDIAYGAGITIQFIQNVIIHGIKIYNIIIGNGGIIRDSENHFGLRTKSDGDGISIFGSSHVWIDHVSMKRCEDGLIDAIMGSTAITISNSYFTDQNEVMLFGATNDFRGDEIMQITLAFNRFGKRLTQRMPRCRFGFIHVVNNDYSHWEMYAIGGSQHPTIISDGNRFTAPDNIHAKEITKRQYSDESEWKDWQWRSFNDVYRNGAYFVESGSEKADRSFSRFEMMNAKPGSHVGRLTRYAGLLRCKVGKPC